MLRGLMQDAPLLISSIIQHADHCHGDTEVVSRAVEGGIHRYTYSDAHRRARQLAQALTRLGVGSGDRVGTLAWNGYRHLELYYGISGMGAVMHTINPRLFPEQIAYIIGHAEDRFVCFDLTFAPLVEKLYTVERIEPLAIQARQRFRKLGLRNIRASHSDGTEGLSEFAP